MSIALDLTPEESGYRITFEADVIKFAVEGGFSKFRRASIKPINKTLPHIDVTWYCNAQEYDYIRAFYRLVQFTASAFRINLLVDDPTISEHTVQFVKGTMKLAEIHGDQYLVKATLAIVS
jgi:hypothetical protein